MVDTKYFVYDLVRRLSKSNNFLVKEKDLSNLIIEIDKESDSKIVLSPVKYVMEGLATPELYSILNDLQIFSIIKKIGEDAYVLTNKGEQYIKEKIAKINLHYPRVYKKFSKIAEETIKKYFK